jgi:thioredoxin 1
MKKTLLFSVMMLLFSTLTFAQNGKDGIQFFQGSFKEALAKAKAEKKMIFMDAYTTWCGPCRMLKHNVFPDKALGEYFNKKFVSVAVDWESAQGVELSRAYSLQAYPTMFFIDANGKTITTNVGYPRGGAGELLAFAQKVGK